MNQKIIFLAGEGDSTRIMYHALQSSFDIETVILEQPVSKSKIIKRRVKRLGYLKVAGQVLFQGICTPLLKQFATSRRNLILKEYDLNPSPIPSHKTIKVSSVNSKKCRKFLKRINPAVVVVNGTRIISGKVLNSTSAVFLNTHAGITPKYRGVHGGYWALAYGDKEHCGVTVHIIDEGIDTGSVLFQDTIEPSTGDNFTTYPLLQLAKGIPLMKKAINGVLGDKLTPVQPMAMESRLYYHPTIWFYLYKLLTKGVK